MQELALLEAISTSHSHLRLSKLKSCYNRTTTKMLSQSRERLTSKMRPRKWRSRSRELWCNSHLKMPSQTVTSKSSWRRWMHLRRTSKTKCVPKVNCKTHSLKRHSRQEELEERICETRFPKKSMIRSKTTLPTKLATRSMSMLMKLKQSWWLIESA